MPCPLLLVCSQVYFQNVMEIHFLKSWLDNYRSETAVGTILGLAYGEEYCDTTQTNSLPSDAVRALCHEYYFADKGDSSDDA